MGIGLNGSGSAPPLDKRTRFAKLWPLLNR